MQHLVFPQRFIAVERSDARHAGNFLDDIHVVIVHGNIHEQKAEPRGSILGDFVDTWEGCSPELTHDGCFGCCCWDRRSGIEAAVKPRGVHLAVPSVPGDLWGIRVPLMLRQGLSLPERFLAGVEMVCGVNCYNSPCCSVIVRGWRSSGDLAITSTN